MQCNKIYIELGGNEGNRLQLIHDAKQFIKNAGCKILEQSSVFETPPWGFSSNLNFYNQIIKIGTKLNAKELITKLQSIETNLGRVRTKKKYESRTMDIDILFFNNEIIDEKGLTIPHPRLHLRKFVLEPMNEIAPNFVHPVFKTTINQLLKNCEDNSYCQNL